MLKDQVQLDKIEVVKRLKLAVKKVGSQKAFARETKSSNALVSLVLNGERNPSDGMLDYIGVKRVTLYIYYNASKMQN